MTSRRRLVLSCLSLSSVFTLLYFQIRPNKGSEQKNLCNQNVYQSERAIAQQLVKDRIDAIKSGENLPLLLPVEYIFTTGDKHDANSYLAYLRSIMRVNDDGESIIQTANSRMSYLTDHRNARADFISGKRRYFSVVEVKEMKNHDYANTYQLFKQKHKFSNLDAWNILKAHMNSGFKQVTDDYITHYERTGELDMANIILADIRNPIAPHLRGIPFMKVLKQKDEMMATFSRDRNIQGFSYKPYAGMPQIIQRFDCESMSAILTTSFRITQGQELHAEIVEDP